MTAGWLGLWNQILGTKVRWQASEPDHQYRIRPPDDAVTVIATRWRGRDPRRAFRCPKCGTYVISPDQSYET